MLLRWRPQKLVKGEKGRYSIRSWGELKGMGERWVQTQFSPAETLSQNFAGTDMDKNRKKRCPPIKQEKSGSLSTQTFRVKTYRPH